MLVEDVINEFRRHHAGASPQEVLIDQAAAVILASKGQLPPRYSGVPCRLVSAVSPAEPGKGQSVGLVATQLRGGMVGVVACEAEGLRGSSSDKP